MKVHRNDMVASSNDKHIRNKLRGYRCSGLVLLINTRIRETGNNSGDSTCRCSFAGRNQNEQFHQVVIHVVAATLDDEDVLLPHGLANPHTRLSVREFLDDTWRELDIEPTRSLINVRRS